MVGKVLELCKKRMLQEGFNNTLSDVNKLFSNENQGN